MQTQAENQSTITGRALFVDFKEITKAGLAVSVVFSSVAGFLLGIDEITVQNLYILLLLAIGGYCMVGASNAYNQIIEKDLDALMDRTKKRPIPSGRVSVRTAFIIATLMTILGLSILYVINEKTAMFGAISIFLYTCAYTPLKTITPLSVFVGAFPGAIPFMLGWVAATGHFGIEAGTLFLIQFFWQFPHFWAIGWFLYEDYEKAGCYMLPSGKRDQSTAMQTILYTIWLIVASLLPAFLPYIAPLSTFSLSIPAAILTFLLGLWMLYAAIQLYKERTAKSAKKLMLVSVGYITILQLIYIIDKFLR